MIDAIINTVVALMWVCFVGWVYFRFIRPIKKMTDDLKRLDKHVKEVK